MKGSKVAVNRNVPITVVQQGNMGQFVIYCKIRNITGGEIKKRIRNVKSISIHNQTILYQNRVLGDTEKIIVQNSNRPNLRVTLIIGTGPQIIPQPAPIMHQTVNIQTLSQNVPLQLNLNSSISQLKKTLFSKMQIFHNGVLISGPGLGANSLSSFGITDHANLSVRFTGGPIPGQIVTPQPNLDPSQGIDLYQNSQPTPPTFAPSFPPGFQIPNNAPVNTVVIGNTSKTGNANSEPKFQHPPHEAPVPEEPCPTPAEPVEENTGSPAPIDLTPGKNLMVIIEESDANFKTTYFWNDKDEIGKLVEKWKLARSILSGEGYKFGLSFNGKALELDKCLRDYSIGAGSVLIVSKEQVNGDDWAKP